MQLTSIIAAPEHLKHACGLPASVLLLGPAHSCQHAPPGG